MARNLTTGLQRGLRRSIAGGLGASDLFSVASLDLRFAQQKTLDPRITFTRASSGTYVGSDGLIKTATTNLLLRSEEFSDAAWVKRGTCVVVANDATAPNGTLTADKVTFAGSGNDIYYGSLNVAAGATISPSIYVKKITTSGTFTFQSANGASNGSWSVNLSLLNTSWERLTATHPAVTVNTAFTGSGNSFSGFQLFQSSGISTELHLWGAQLEQSSTVGEYIPTTSTINSAPRFDHNPTTGESLGLLVEELRTNLIYPSQFTSFGTVAANNTWYETFTELDCTPNSATAPDGTNTAALLAINTNATSRPVFYRTANTTAGSYTFSVYCKPASTDTLSRLLIGGEAGLTNFVRADFTLAGSGTVGAASTGGTATSPSAPLIQQLTNGWYRCIITATLTSPTNITCLVYPGNPAGQTINSQTFVWGAQLEAGSFPTSYIPTTTATVTRSADVASITGANFSSWYNQTEGTVFAESRSNASTGDRGVFSINASGSSNNRIDTRLPNRSIVSSGGSLVAVMDTSASMVAQALFKTAVAAKLDDFARVTNAGNAATDTLGAMPIGNNQIEIGSIESSQTQLNGTIRRLTYWPSRLSNATLQQITR